MLGAGRHRLFEQFIREHPVFAAWLFGGIILGVLILGAIGIYNLQR